jgi:hypothetical protein
MGILSKKGRANTTKAERNRSSSSQYSDGSDDTRHLAFNNSETSNYHDPHATASSSNDSFQLSRFYKPSLSSSDNAQRIASVEIDRTGSEWEWDDMMEQGLAVRNAEGDLLDNVLGKAIMFSFPLACLGLLFIMAGVGLLFKAGLWLANLAAW